MMDVIDPLESICTDFSFSLILVLLPLFYLPASADITDLNYINLDDSLQ